MTTAIHTGEQVREIFSAFAAHLPDCYEFCDSEREIVREFIRRNIADGMTGDDIVTCLLAQFV
jgi:hypothetical protein